MPDSRENKGITGSGLSLTGHFLFTLFSLRGAKSLIPFIYLPQDSLMWWLNVLLTLVKTATEYNDKLFYAGILDFIR